MPFDPSSGIYTPPAAALTAFPGKVIASADWNNINSDISDALTTLGQQSWATQTPRVISGIGSFTVAATDAVIFVEASAPTITLPLSASKPYPVKIIGAAVGIFNVNNSTVVPTNPDTISGLTSVTLSADYQIATFYPLVTGGYVVAFA